MSSQIGRSGRRLLMALGNVLGIEDVKQGPARLKVDELVPTIALDPGMAGAQHFQLIGSINGNGTGGLITWPIIGGIPSDGTTGIPPQAKFLNNADVETVIHGIRFGVRLGAPNPGNVGRSLQINEMRQAPTDSVSLVRLSQLDGFQIIDEARVQYLWTYPMWISRPWVGNDPPRPYQEAVTMASSPIYVPAGSKYWLELLYWDAAFSVLADFPVGSVIDMQAFYSTCPKGMRPPGI